MKADASAAARMAVVRKGDRRSAPLVVAGTGILLMIAVVLSLSLGATGISLDALPRVLSSWLSGAEAATPEALRERLVILEIRLPRTVLGLLVGAALALSGAVMQGLFRNPLADPGLIGVSSGAALAAVAVIALGDGLLSPVLGLLGPFAVPVSAFVGGLVATAVLYRLATRAGYTSVATLLLAGIALGALAGAVTGIIVFGSDDRELRDLTFWSMGSLGGASWQKIGAALPFLVAALLLIPYLVRVLNAFLLGEAEAGHLGVATERAKRIAMIAVAGAVASAVAVSGVIGFVGIVVPHVLRLVTGPDHRYVLPGSALLGGALLLAADSVARVIVAPAELPIGIVTALFGAPFFLWLLMRRRGGFG
ncbi:iron complex transport system permease protein [Amorphus orientalis]|uniref:Iron complex transport system permease protein n=2 Tax=Amorphus orientalis TaxID=649198 RepID=A0AAE3VQM8_9HYPH|nr:iron complex transport system permease protein [Amorphus orientalis]